MVLIRDMDLILAAQKEIGSNNFDEALQAATETLETKIQSLQAEVDALKAQKERLKQAWVAKPDLIECTMGEHNLFADTKPAPAGKYTTPSNRLTMRMLMLQ